MVTGTRSAGLRANRALMVLLSGRWTAGLTPSAHGPSGPLARPGFGAEDERPAGAQRGHVMAREAEEDLNRSPSIAGQILQQPLLIDGSRLGSRLRVFG